MARRTRDLCKLKGASKGCRSSRESSRPVQKDPVDLCKDESIAEVSLGGKRKRMSGRNGDTLRRNALKRGDSAVCGRMISCSRGQAGWGTELELCRRESFDNDHRSTAVRAAP